MEIKYYLGEYLKQRPLFLSLIRAKEATLYQRYLPLKSPVLDVGCGDGFFAKVAFQVPLKVEPLKVVIDVGLDVEDSRIEEAGRLDIYKKLVTYDGGRLPFPSRSFNTGLSNCVLEHIENLDNTVSEIKRVLRPGGLFLTTVMAKPWEEHLFGAKLLGDFYKNWMRTKQIHRNLLSREGWDEIFQKSGFKISNRVGYLSPRACRLIDICHYLSIPSLISYKLFGKWVLTPQVNQQIYPVNYFSEILSEKISPDQSGAIFYILRKI